MKLFAIIEEKSTDKTTQLYVDERDGRNVLKIISVAQGRIVHVEKEVLGCFKNFILGTNRKYLGSIHGYEVILDKDSHLLHYFKEGKEDYQKLLTMNGSPCGMADIPGYSPYKGKRPKKNRKYVCGDAVIVLEIAVVLSLGFFAGTLNVVARGEVINLASSVTYILDVEEKDKFDKPISYDDIKDYIYNRSGINSEVVKDFLWNPELVADVMPCYEGTNLGIISRIRHNDLGIVDYTEREKQTEDTNGYYSYENVLHVRDYDEFGFDPKSKIAKTTAHEYVHLLQTQDCYPFVKEAIDEIIVHEYYFDSGLSTDSYSYRKACKYLKVLMEIVGSDAVWDNSFRRGSTMLDDAVEPYLTSEEFKEFKRILNLHPYHNKEVLDASWSKLETILDKIHLNKNGYSMYSDSLINCILKDGIYNRLYFRASLLEKVSSYYRTDTLSYRDAVEMGYMWILLVQPASKEQYFDKTYWPDASRCRYIEPLIDCHILEAYYYDDSWYGVIELKDGTLVSVKYALEKNLVEERFELEKVVSIEEYEEQPFNQYYYFCPLVKCTMDEEHEQIILPDRINISVDRTLKTPVPEGKRNHLTERRGASEK